MRTILLLLFLYSSTANASVLDQALSLVLSESKVIGSHKTMVASGKRSWSSKLRLRSGYAMKTTTETASGLDAGAMFTFEIPLFSNEGDRNRAKDIKALSSAEDSLRSAFLKAVKDLVKTKAQLCTGAEMHSLKVDKLRYFEQLQKGGGYDADKLWTHAMQVKEAEHGLFEMDLQYQMEVVRITRKFGLSQHQRLRTMLEQYTANTVDCEVDTEQV